jgi:ADP-ribosyl-[dinitrogen reductase] hydrolase
MNMPSLRSRILGGLYGSLVGDALGVPVEFSDRHTLDRDPVRGMRGYGTWKQPPGTWSDDGAMTLASADVLAQQGWEPGALMEGFRRWLDEGWWTAHGSAFDIGNATRGAIVAYRMHGDWRSCGRTDERSNGNGSLMRCLPISAWLLGETEAGQRIALAGEASALTHAHPRSRLCCAWHALWFAAALEDPSVRTQAATAARLLAPAVPPAERGPLAGILDGDALDRRRSAVVSDGYVVSTLAASLWCLANHDGFAAQVLAAVNLGSDTDTTGCVAGGMSGWLHGIDAIPSEWLAALPRQAELRALAERFADRCLARLG